MKTPGRGRTITVAGIFVMLAVLVLPRAALAEGDQSAEQQLADKFAPVIMTLTQPKPCSDDGEPYMPMSVDAVLGNRQVALRQVGSGNPVVKWGPTAADLAGLGEGFYLDFPGQALEPGCLYEKDSRRFDQGRRASVYARVATQADTPGQLALQFYIYWYFNDWNNKHESDWEFVQLIFDANTASDALGKEPVEVGYAQHEGGEASDWEDSKLSLDGTHPVVFASRGSHASYYDSSLYLGRSASEGFGCDTTAGDTTANLATAILLPTDLSTITAESPFAWLLFDGRWGERQDGPNNGPTGPAAKYQWSHPIDWQDSLRSISVKIPIEAFNTSPAADVFCGAVQWSATRYISFLRNPVPTIAVLIGIGLLVWLLVRRTVWDAVPLRPLVARRRFGEILRTAVGLYRRHAVSLMSLSLLSLPFVAVATVMSRYATARLMDSTTQDSPGAEVIDRNSDALLASMGGTLVTLALMVVIFAVVAHMLAAETEAIGTLRPALRATLRKSGWLILGWLLSLVVPMMAAISLVLIPVVVWLIVRLAHTPTVIVIENRRPLAALKRSFTLVSKRWWRTLLVFALAVGSVVVLVQVSTLAILMLGKGLPLALVSVLGSAIGTMFLPFVAVVVTLLYGDAVAERAGIGAVTVPSIGGPSPEPVVSDA